MLPRVLAPAQPTTGERRPPATWVARELRSPVSVARALIVLTKPRLAAMSVLTTAVAYLHALPTFDASHASAVLGATLLSAAGALGLNQWRERDTDALMRRTRGRPLPQQQLSPVVALSWTLLLGLTGVTGLALAANALAAALSALTIAIYALVYTPLKRRSRWATEVGAISGALPPLIGAAAATGTVTPFGLFLAGVLFLWQMPHFFAIGWACRTDYQAAGLPLLPAVDTARGERTARTCVAYAAALLVAVPTAAAAGACGPVCATVATIAGGLMLQRSLQFHRAAREAPAGAEGTERRDATARRLFVVSLAYVPAILLAALAG